MNRNAPFFIMILDIERIRCSPSTPDFSLLFLHCFLFTILRIYTSSLLCANLLGGYHLLCLLKICKLKQKFSERKQNLPVEIYDSFDYSV